MNNIIRRNRRQIISHTHIEKTFIKKAIDCCTLIILLSTLSVSISSYVFYYWHKNWFESLGISFDLAWFKLEIASFCLTNIIYLLLFLGFALVIDLTFYRSIRGVFLNSYSDSYKKLTTNSGMLIVPLVGYIFLIIPLFMPNDYKTYFFVLPILSFIFIPSIYMSPYFDKLITKMRRIFMSVGEPSYSREDIYIFPGIIILTCILYFLFNIKIILNPFLFLWLFIIYAFAPMLSPSDGKEILSKYIAVFFSIAIIIIFPIVIITDEAKRDTLILTNRIAGLSNKKEISNNYLPMDGLISSQSLQKGALFAENIGSFSKLIKPLSEDEVQNKILTDRYFISSGDLTFVFCIDSKQKKTLVMKDGKILRIVPLLFSGTSIRR